MAINFRNRAAYERWLAYGHIHDKFHGRKKVKIKGKPHHVKHTRSR